ncbi:hypothetical protein [Microbacterium sp.]|uniref:hypothetical protein n=1 Tax=Microbacterium sp. TaxID=51671 RepID=UPI003A951950
MPSRGAISQHAGDASISSCGDGATSVRTPVPSDASGGHAVLHPAGDADGLRDRAR